MQEFIIGENEAGQRLDKYLQKRLKYAPVSFFHKMLRKKNIVLNDRKVDGSVKTAVGDSVKLYLSDETILKFQTGAGAEAETDTEKPAKASYEKKQEQTFVVPVIYQDKHVLALNKPAGMLSQRAQASDYSVVEFVQDYVKQGGLLSSQELETFAPGICNRLDRNTSGLMLAGISLPGLQQLNEAIRLHQIKKYYLCVVEGVIETELHLRGILEKDHNRNQVSIKTSGASHEAGAEIRTDVLPLKNNGKQTLLCVWLITGKTHQIRGHLASIGHPLVGDHKYGCKVKSSGDSSKKKRPEGMLGQMLHSWRMRMPAFSGVLSALSGKTLEAPLPKPFEAYIKKHDLVPEEAALSTWFKREGD